MIMSALSSSPTRRGFASAAAGAAGVLSSQSPAATSDAQVSPFRVNAPEDALADLRRRINTTRWPDGETVTDESQGVRLATIQELARYWATDYDWRNCEAKLNALPQFITEIDELDIHFIHVRSRHENALPLIVTHGWPGSVIEQLKIIDPLTNPAGMARANQTLSTWLFRRYRATVFQPGRPRPAGTPSERRAPGSC
jgi:Epoxide hydrolase N terminus